MERRIGERRERRGRGKREKRGKEVAWRWRLPAVGRKEGVWVGERSS